ncbi:MAG TPA: histidine phosphatase family protein [Firmicutes bacterium]|nr:histidine phosphatase family protein [Bacillota bacterium]
MRLILVRHGETEWNKEFRLQGTSDVHLSALGRRQARQLAEWLPDKPDRIFSSPLLRVREFAAPLAERHGLPVEIIQDLREMSFGRWEGLRYADMEPVDRELFEKWCLDPVHTLPPGGEPAAALGERVARFLERISEELAAEEVAVAVTHGGIIRTAVTLAMQMPPAAAGRMQIYTASVTILDYYASAWHLVKLNDTCHLAN